jgi:hypothetical protein
MNVVDILSIAAAFAVTGWFIRTALAKDRDEERFEEDDAREFFDEHGHWPDETPEQARARAEQAALNERLARAEDRD